MEGPEDSIIEL